MTWETVIGLEVHAQLKTQSKLFSGASISFGAKPNSQTSFIDAGLPGVLPVLNQEAVNMAIKLGLSLNAEINNYSYFERKNYFYPDLPKGYQISQYQRPIISNGYVTISVSGEDKKVEIVRAHLEEDAGKSLHDAHNAYTGIDLNRAGTALLEIVTSPCLYSADEAVAYLKTLHQLVRFLDICDGNMQEGSFRCDVNLSLRPSGSKTLGTRTELKNLNSFRFIEKAIAYEQYRHQELLESGQAIIQETRLYSPNTNSTIPMRSKENENDYRYFTDPDLLPIEITDELLHKVKEEMPTLPWELKKQLIKENHFSAEEAEFLISSPSIYHFFTETQQISKAPAKLIINWIRGTYSAALNDQGKTFANPPISPQDLSLLLDSLHENKISSKIAKTIFLDAAADKGNVGLLLSQAETISDSNQSDLEELIKELIAQFPEQASEYRAGKEKLIAFFVGQVMKKTKGSAEPGLVNGLLKKHLG